MALRSQGPPGLASNRDRREAPPWRVLPLVVVVDNVDILNIYPELFSDTLGTVMVF